MQLISNAFMAIVLVILGFKLYLNYRNANAIKRHLEHVPETFAKSVTLEEHQKAGYYNLAKLKLANIEEIISSIMLLLFTLGGLIQFINDKFGVLVNSSSPLSQGVVVIACFSVLSMLIGLPFKVYATFGIEQKFGFNNTTVSLFIMDSIKGIILSIVIGIPLLYLVLWLMQVMGGYWWIWVWAVLVAFSLLILIIYPTFIAPLFNKFTPLVDDELKQRICSLLTRCGFVSNGVFVMDGSKRSSHGNAYFTGIGRSKRIVFFDTLIKQLTPSEVEAVLAHELGHFKKKHILKQIILSFAINLLVLFILSLLIHQEVFYQALGVSTITNYNGLLLFSLLIGLFSFPFAPLASYFSRKNEFEADSFANENSNKSDLISGLVKLYKDNASTLTPDELYVKFYYSHPPASVRIKALEQLA